MPRNHNKANYILLELKPNGDIKYLNDFGERLFDLRLKDISGKNIKGILVKKEDDNFLQQAYEAINIGKVSLDDYFEYHHIINEKDNFNILWIFHFIYNKDGSIELIACIGTNVTPRDIRQEKKEDDQRIDTLKHERNRIANEIHDTISQTLFSLNLASEHLHRLYKKDRKEEFLESIKTIQKLGNSALSEIRVLLYELKPDRIMEETFAELIKSNCQAIFSKTSLGCNINDFGEDFPFTYDEKFSLYRICQQAFFNIYKHSKASKAIISLESDSTKMKIKISDNGIGFNTNKISPNSLGIKIMKDRAKSIGANLEIKSTPKQGTTIHIEYERTLKS